MRFFPLAKANPTRGKLSTHQVRFFPLALKCMTRGNLCTVTAAGLLASLAIRSSPAHRSGRKNSRMSPTSASGASCGAKWLPRSYRRQCTMLAWSRSANR